MRLTRAQVDVILDALDLAVLTYKHDAQNADLSSEVRALFARRENDSRTILGLMINGQIEGVEP